MPQPTNHWKLGLFVMGGMAVALGTVIFLGASSLRKQSVSYVTYFDESVQGLEVGSQVKFRGLTVGRVARIDIAPDQRHVAVTCALSTEDLHDFGLADGKGTSTRLPIPPDLRVQLVSQGITGLKFLQIDFFPVKDYPPPQLAFELPANYIPAADSTIKHLEGAVVNASDRIPEMLEALAAVTKQTSRMMDQLENQKIPESVARTLASLERLMLTMQGAINDLNLKRLSAQAQEGLANLNATVARANAVLARLEGKGGLLASAQRATDALGDFAAMSPELGQELVETLRNIREASASFQRVAEALERDPDMLIKGRARVK